MGPLVSVVTAVEDAKNCQGDFIVGHVYGKNSSTEKTFLTMVTISRGDYITLVYL